MATLRRSALRRIDTPMTYAYVPKSLGEPKGPQRHGQWTTVILECSHSLAFQFSPPKLKEKVWCTRCQKEKRVTVRYRGVGGYHVKCENCRFGKSFGETRTLAEMAMGRHRLKEPRHTICLYDGDGTLVDRWESALANQLDLFNDPDDDKPPF